MPSQAPREVMATYRWPVGVIIGDSAPAPAPPIGIDVLGGFALCNPARPGDPPVLDVVDPVAGRLVICALFGESAIEAVERVMRQGATELVLVERTATQRELTRLAQVRWCQQFSPVPLDPDLLRCEELLLLGRLASICEESEGWDEQLLVHCGRLMRSRQHHPEPVEQLFLEVLELLGEAEGSVADLASMAQASQVDPASAPHPETIEMASASAALDLKAEFYTGSDTVDWFDVPRGWTSSAENNVHWCMQLSDQEAMIRVVVDAPSQTQRYFPAAQQRPGERKLAFDIEVPGWPIPVLSGALSQAEDWGCWRGVGQANQAQTELLRRTLEAGQEMTVRVRSRCSRAAQDRAWAEATRWAGRGLAWARLAQCGGRQAASVEATAALARATELFAELGCSDEAEECQRLLTGVESGGEPFIVTTAERWLAQGG